MLSHITVMNGPSKSGKSTAIDLIDEHAPQTLNIRKLKASDFVFRAACILFGLDWDEEEYNMRKDEPLIPINNEGGKVSLRTAMIKLSEEDMKPFYGKGVFGLAMVEKIKKMILTEKEPFMLLTDCGFVEELQPITEAFGRDNISLVQVYRDGYIFNKAHDSRSWICDPSLYRNTYMLNNPGNSLEELKIASLDLYSEILSNIGRE